MSDLPPPTPGPVLPPSTPVDPQKAVQLPAMALMGMSALYVLYVLYLIGASIFGFAIAGAGGDKLSILASGAGMVIGVLLNLAIAGLTFYGGMQMKNLRKYNIALAGAIAAMFPCSYCCCIGIGIGIWALVILMKPEVKAAFTK